MESRESKKGNCPGREEGPSEHGAAERAEQLLEQSVVQMKRLVSSEFAEFVALLKRPSRLIWANLLLGIARGTGMAIGMSIIGAAVVALLYIVLKYMVSIPLIGEFAAKIIDAVQQQMQ